MAWHVLTTEQLHDSSFTTRRRDGSQRHGLAWDATLYAPTPPARRAGAFGDELPQAPLDVLPRLPDVRLALAVDLLHERLHARLEEAPLLQSLALCNPGVGAAAAVGVKDERDAPGQVLLLPELDPFLAEPVVQGDGLSALRWPACCSQRTKAANSPGLLHDAVSLNPSRTRERGVGWGRGRGSGGRAGGCARGPGLRVASSTAWGGELHRWWGKRARSAML